MITTPYQICTKTVMDTSDPNISFNAKGECNYYSYFNTYIKPFWDKSIIDKERILEKKITQIKKEGKGKDFDCIIGLSGGTDSSYMLHKIVNDYNLRPLVFHVDAGWNSEIAVNNISVLVNKLNLDLYTEVINWDEMKHFQLAMFKSGLPGIDIPQDMAFIGILYKFAVKYNIKTILNGGNISTENVDTPFNLMYWGSDMRLIRDILKSFGTQKMKTYPFSSVFYHRLYLTYIKKIKRFLPLNFLDYKKYEAEKILSETYGWKPYGQKHFESRFTAFLEGYWLVERFGYDMRRRELSSLILTNQMTRKEALKILTKPSFDQITIKNEFRYVADKLKISQNELKSYFNQEKKFYWDYKNQKNLISLGETIIFMISGQRRGGII